MPPLKNESWQPFLRDALAVLSLQPADQCRVNGPGCVACDLLNDFDFARLTALDNAPNLSDEQRTLLDQIDAIMERMQEPDFECFNNEVLQRPVWQQLRELSADALRVFGWENVVVQPGKEIKPGIWHRPWAEDETGPPHNS